ncbi:MAG: Ig-like domain-containing protein [Anaerocolumna sp.]
MKKNKLFQLFRFKGGISIIYYVAFLALLWYLIVPHTSFYFMNNIFTPFSKRLNEEDITLVKGEKFTLSLMNVNKRLSYSSSDIKVADVNIFGKVNAYRVGTTIIRVKYKDDVLKCRVRVIDINKGKLTLKEGNSSWLSIKGVWFGVRWSSSNTAIVSVNRFGKVTAISKGTAKIYGKVRGKIMTCIVTVK